MEDVGTLLGCHCDDTLQVAAVAQVHLVTIAVHPDALCYLEGFIGRRVVDEDDVIHQVAGKTLIERLEGFLSIEGYADGDHPWLFHALLL